METVLQKLQDLWNLGVPTAGWIALAVGAVVLLFACWLSREMGKLKREEDQRRAGNHS